MLLVRISNISCAVGSSLLDDRSLGSVVCLLSMALTLFSNDSLPDEASLFSGDVEEDDCSNGGGVAK